MRPEPQDGFSAEERDAYMWDHEELGPGVVPDCDFGDSLYEDEDFDYDDECDDYMYMDDDDGRYDE